MATTRRKCNSCGEHFIPEQDNHSWICSPCSWQKQHKKEKQMSVEIVKKSEHGYTTQGVAFKIMHTLDLHNIVEMLNTLIAERGEAYVREIFDSVLPTRSVGQGGGGYMCAVVGAGAPSYTHTNESAAVKEAEKLAKQHNKSVMVLERVCTVVPQTQVTTTIRHP